MNDYDSNLDPDALEAQDELFGDADDHISLGEDLSGGEDGPLLTDPLDFGDVSLEDSEPLFSEEFNDEDPVLGSGLDFDNVDLEPGPQERKGPAIEVSEENSSPPPPRKALDDDNLGLDEDLHEFKGGHHFGDAPQSPSSTSQDLSTTPASPANHPLHSASSGKGKKSLDLTVILGVIAGIMVVGALIVVLTSGSTVAEIVEEEPSEPVYRAPVVEVVNVRTSPPALRILVNGHSRGFSPLQVRVAENEFPVTIKARVNDHTELERVLTEHEAEVFFDFTSLLKDR